MHKVLFCHRTKRPTFDNKSSKIPGVASVSQRTSRSQLSAVCARSTARARHAGNRTRAVLWILADTPDPTLIERLYRRSKRLRRITQTGFGVICRLRRNESLCILAERARALLRAQFAKRRGLEVSPRTEVYPKLFASFYAKRRSFGSSKKEQGIDVLQIVDKNRRRAAL